MGEVLPLCASPRSLFLSTFRVFNQNVTQSLKDVLSSFNKFRWARPPIIRSLYVFLLSPIVRLFVVYESESVFLSGAPLTVYDRGWCLFSVFAFCCTALSIRDLTDGDKFIFIFELLGAFVDLGFMLLHVLVMYSIVYWYLDMPFRLIGAKAKFMIEVIPFTTAAALHQLSVSNYAYLRLMLGCTAYFYTIAHLMHVAYDISAIDVLLGIVMQVLAFTLNAEFLVRALVLSFCFGLCVYRYMTYCAPELPAHCKKEMERLPC